MWLACLAPSGRMGLDAVSGLFPMMAVLSAGRSAGWLCWAAAGILGLVLLPDKGVALLFLAFFGLYPVLKGKIEAFQSRMLRCVSKLAYFNAVLAVFWFFLRQLFLPEAPAWLERGGLIWILGNMVFIAYDIGLSQLIFGLFSRIPKVGGAGRR